MKPETFAVTFAVKPAEPAADSGAVRFSGVAYSGDLIPSYGWHGDVAIDLATLQNAQGDSLPVLIDHDQRIDSIAGKGRLFRVEQNGMASLAIEGELTAATEAGEKIAALMGEGYPVQLSVGMSANLRETREPVLVNGRTLKVSAVFENPLIREVSFVAVAADANTSATVFSLARIEPTKETSMQRTPEDQAEIDRLNAEVAELKASIETARAERRRADLSALFAAVGRDAPEDAAPYLDMTDAAFSAFAADLKAVASSVPPRDAALFRADSLSHSGKPGPEDGLAAEVKRLCARTQVTL